MRRERKEKKERKKLICSQNKCFERCNKGKGQLHARTGHEDTRWRWVVNATPWLLTPGKDPVLIVQEAGWSQGLVWTGAENLASTGIRSPDHPARSESLYLLSYPGPRVVTAKFILQIHVNSFFKALSKMKSCIHYRMKCFKLNDFQIQNKKKNMFVLKTFIDGWVVTRHDEFGSTKDMFADGLPFSMLRCCGNGMVNKCQYSIS